MRETDIDRAIGFLVEDVVLALGNMRGALDWFSDDAGLTADQRRAGLERLGRQIARIEDRLRAITPPPPARPAEFRSRRSRRPPAA